MGDAISRLETLSVADVMSRDVVWVSTRQHMADVAAVLVKHQLTTAPVVDESGCCVGVISASDYLKRDSAEILRATPNERLRAAWRPEDVVETYMSTGVQTVPATAGILHAARVMCAQHIHRLPVVNHEGRPVGMISTMDVVAALLNAVDESRR